MYKALFGCHIFAIAKRWQKYGGGLTHVPGSRYSHNPPEDIMKMVFSGVVYIKGFNPLFRVEEVGFSIKKIFSQRQRIGLIAL